MPAASTHTCATKTPPSRGLVVGYRWFDIERERARIEPTAAPQATKPTAELAPSAVQPQKTSDIKRFSPHGEEKVKTPAFPIHDGSEQTRQDPDQEIAGKFNPDGSVQNAPKTALESSVSVSGGIKPHGHP